MSLLCCFLLAVGGLYGGYRLVRKISDNKIQCVYEGEKPAYDAEKFVQLPVKKGGDPLLVLSSKSNQIHTVNQLTIQISCYHTASLENQCYHEVSLNLSDQTCIIARYEQ